MENGAEFEALIAAIVRRYCAQNAAPPPDVADLARFTTQLRRLVVERGLPAPLAPSEMGQPGGMPDSECQPLVARVVAGTTHALFAECARQLVKACFYPEFRRCRDSFREPAPDGSCRRQELSRVRTRVSGTHCVDCPHWTALSEPEHVSYLRREWRRDPTEFDVHRGIFLPEDFRALRWWLHRAARLPR